MFAFVLLSVLALLASPAESALLIGNNTWVTSDYVYYGPNDQFIFGTAVTLSGIAACDEAGDFMGKIVVSSHPLCQCTTTATKRITIFRDNTVKRPATEMLTIYVSIRWLTGLRRIATLVTFTPM